MEFKFIPLTFISNKEEIKKQIKNTIALRYILDKHKDIRKLGTLLESTQYGYTASAKEEGDCHLLRITDIQEGTVNWEAVPFCDCKEKEIYLLKQNDILVARTGGTTGKSYIITEEIYDTVFASYLIKLRSKSILNPNYLHLFLNSYMYWSQITQLKRGSAQPNVNAQKLKELMIPYCSIEEQANIVALSNGDSLDYDSEIKYEINDAIDKFHFNLEMSDLFDKQLVLVNQLRQSILQEAVQGKLVPQDPNDEPASTLLEKIKAEKEKLIKEGKLKKEKPLPPIKEDEIPYELPKGWEWVRLDDLTQKIGSGSTPRGGKSVYKEDGIMFIRSQNVWNSGLKIDNIAYISEEINNQMANTQVLPMDLLLNITGASIGRSCIIPENFSNGNVSQHVSIVRLVRKDIGQYIHDCIISPFFQIKIMDIQVGISREGLSKSSLSKFLVSLPPLNEQKRILDKVDELMKLCDQLESQLEQSKEESEKLMQAVLQEAFQGTE